METNKERRQKTPTVVALVSEGLQLRKDAGEVGVCRGGRESAFPVRGSQMPCSNLAARKPRSVTGSLARSMTYDADRSKIDDIAPGCRILIYIRTQRDVRCNAAFRASNRLIHECCAATCVRLATHAEDCGS